MECAGASLSPLVSGPCILLPPTSNSNRQAIDKNEQGDCCSTSPGIKEIRPGAMITDVRIEYRVQRISRSAALGIFQGFTIVHFPAAKSRRLTSSKICRLCLPRQWILPNHWY
ncbi:hypothetical protein PILCRDRAFT_517014 [Piloderma croceum F 1598]|uniref:Uncharacterized protein n=1 Tax=Piloderma croceum (strain F 1598) TaxID=765440 RepID=A0A0C3B3L2_PILCF|nr:hypothetical protein PILCRDRAFT_517014 [Piloderma croceum F 1598]